jgi:hypothetical protein
MADSTALSYLPRMPSLRRLALASLVACALAALVHCSSSDSTTPASTDGGGGGDSGAADSGALTVKIITPADKAKFKTTDPIPLKGEATDPVEGTIVDPERTLWFGGLKGGGVNPEGESPEDTIPAQTFEAGTYTIEFYARTLKDASASTTVEITVE